MWGNVPFFLFFKGRRHRLYQPLPPQQEACSETESPAASVKPTHAASNPADITIKAASEISLNFRKSLPVPQTWLQHLREGNIAKLMSQTRSQRGQGLLLHHRRTAGALRHRINTRQRQQRSIQSHFQHTRCPRILLSGKAKWIILPMNTENYLGTADGPSHPWSLQHHLFQASEIASKNPDYIFL